MTGAWHVERVVGPAGEIHARSWPAPLVPTIWICIPDRPALVLGSTQRDTDVRADRARARGIDVVRRASGGGAVWVEPGGTLWVDVLLPRDDPRWDDDVGRAAYWLGAVWAEALGPDASVHRSAMVRGPLAERVCFAGRGPGEVFFGDRKAVGISQRRTRSGARFQCVAYERWDPEPLVALLDLSPADAALATAAGASLGSRLPALEEALVENMP